MALTVIHTTLMEQDPRLIDRIKNLFDYAQEVYTSQQGHKTLRVISDDVPQDDSRIWPVFYDFDGINHPVIIGFE